MSVPETTRDLLQRAAEYLRRLPPVETNLRLARDIEEHLRTPEVLASAREDTRAKTLVGSCSVGLLGLPAWHAQVVDQRLYFGFAPELEALVLENPERGAERKEIMARALLEKGMVVIDLTSPPVGYIPPEGASRIPKRV